jgi:predicted LPLAT superfamily acyltransferase
MHYIENRQKSRKRRRRRRQYVTKWENTSRKYASWKDISREMIAEAKSKVDKRVIVARTLRPFINPLSDEQNININEQTGKSIDE